MSGFTKRDETYKWETDDVKIRIYYPEKYGNTNYAGNWSRDSTDRDRPREIGRIYQEYERKIGSYRCPAEMTYSGQDMSYWVKYREDLFNNYKQEALNSISKEWIRLITNCKTILTSYEYDMFEEFKKVYPNMANYFNLKANDITWDIAGSGDNNMMIFTDCIIKCVLSQEALNKKNEKIRKQREISIKYQEEQKLLLYKKEFECAKLFDEIDKNKLKSSELYVEYKKISEKKEQDSIFNIRTQNSSDRFFRSDYGRNDNCHFINYFTEDKKKYINGLIELVKNPTPVNNEGRSNATQPVSQPVSQVQLNKEQDTSKNNIVMTVVEIKENNTNLVDVCDTSVKKPTKKELRKNKDIIRVLNIFTNQNMKKKYFDSGIYKVVLNTPLYEPINEYNKKCFSSYKLGEYLDFLYKKEISEFCLDDKKYYEFMSKSTLIPL
jgi:hypothetical protein